MLAVGCVILAFGMTIVIRSQAGTGPNDLVAVVLSDKSGKPFGPVRIGVDLTFALVGFALGGVVGIGTIICEMCIRDRSLPEPGRWRCHSGRWAAVRWYQPSGR